RYREARAAPARPVAPKGGRSDGATGRRGQERSDARGAIVAGNGRRKDGPKKRLTQLEREIGSAETRLAELTGVLSNPALNRGASLGDVSREYETLTHRLQEMYGEWEALAAE